MGYAPQHLSFGVLDVFEEMQDVEVSKPLAIEVSEFHVLVAKALKIDFEESNM